MNAPHFLPSLALATLAALAALAASCAPQMPYYSTNDYLGSDGTQLLGEYPYQPGGPRAQAGSRPRNDGSFWRGESASGSPKVRISLAEQRAYFYKGKELVGLSPIASGKEGYRTPAGSYAIQQKNRNHRSTLYGDFVDAAGNVVQADVSSSDKRPPGTTFKGASMPYFMRFNGAVGMHAGYLPGYAASHGCVRLPEELAAHFFNNVSNGTPVIVE
jgi:hypothetical protein